MRGFWYLASPYSCHPGGINVAYAEACSAAALLIQADVPVFSPIAHSHSIALLGQIDPTLPGVWMAADRPLMNAAVGIIVLRLEGWDNSCGIEIERRVFREAGKPEVLMDAGKVPAVLFGSTGYEPTPDGWERGYAPWVV